MRTEDHPLEYADFEGLIPEGRCGAGAVIVWDRGIYRTADGRPPRAGLEEGKLEVELQGYKLAGRWVLVRSGKSASRNWLLIATGGQPANGKELRDAQPESVLSARTVEELRRGVDREQELIERARQAGAACGRVDAATVDPMLAAACEGPFSRPGWFFELKYDGVRALVEKNSDATVHIYSRTHAELGRKFPELAWAAAQLACRRFVLDGEIVALGEQGVPPFELLQRRLGQSATPAPARTGAAVPVVLCAFDVLEVSGCDLRPLPLAVRKEILRRLVPPRGPVRFAEHIEERGEELFRAVAEAGGEGIVAKRASSPYRGGARSREWLKIKVGRTADLAIVGFVRGKGRRGELGALMVAWRRGGELVYAGNVGTGFDAQALACLPSELAARRRATPAFQTGTAPLPRGAVFVEPGLVAEVRYAQVTSSGALREPVFLRLRRDKTLEECDSLPAPARPIAARMRVRSRPEKLFWPADGYTKGDLLDYYEAIWPAIGPYLRDRPLVLGRFPDGVEGKGFFRKRVPACVPAWVSTCEVGGVPYFTCRDLESLLYVVNLGCIPLHAWSARYSDPEHPDWAVLDLDPHGVPFASVVAVAQRIHSLLEAVQLPHFAKTSGQEGLHVLIALSGDLSHREARMLAEIVGRAVVAELPEMATLPRTLRARAGKVYVDCLQNGWGKTIAAPYSVRPLPGAPVSTPVAWEELSPRLEPQRFHIKTVPERWRRRGDPMAPLLGRVGNVREALQRLAACLGG